MWPVIPAGWQGVSFSPLCSSVGQTFFLTSFAGAIREDFGLTHGGFGMIYMLATLGSAATLIGIGRILDEVRVVVVAVSLILLLACSALLLASARSVAVLLLAVYVLSLGVPRSPSLQDRDNQETGRQWTRAEVLRDVP